MSYSNWVKKDHTIKILLFLVLGIGILSNCQRATKPAWTPQYLDKEQAPLVDAIAKAIINPTGATSSQIPIINNFIDTTLLHASGYEQLQFRKGIKLIEKQAAFFTGKSFLNCSQEEQQKFLTLQETEAKDSWKRTGKKPYFLTFKELVLDGAKIGEK